MQQLKTFFKILSYEEVGELGRAQKNRQINSKHVNDFLNIIKNAQFMTLDDGTTLVYGIIPVIINPLTKHVLDGQHRIEAFKEAVRKGLIPPNTKILVGLWSITDEAHENEVTVMLNTKSKNWSLNDFIEAYAHDIDYFHNLQEFCKNHSLCYNQHGEKTTLNYRYGASIITGKCCHAWLKDGTLSFTADQLAVAENVHDEMAMIRTKLNLKNSTDIEQMAVEWHKQRQITDINDIMSLNYIPSAVTNMQIRNGQDWRMIFSLLDNQIRREKAKKAA